jgi:hypothetical protein
MSLPEDGMGRRQSAGRVSRSVLYAYTIACELQGSELKSFAALRLTSGRGVGSCPKNFACTHDSSLEQLHCLLGEQNNACPKPQSPSVPELQG